jgi:hypothetical protein
MTIREAITLFGFHQRADLRSGRSKVIIPFCKGLTEKLSKFTRRLRYASSKPSVNT